MASCEGLRCWRTASPAFPPLFDCELFNWRPRTFVPSSVRYWLLWFFLTTKLRLSSENYLTFANMQLRAPERDFIFSATAKVYPLLQPYLAASASPLLDLRKWITVASGKHAGILRHYLRELSTFVSAATRPPTVAAAIAHLSSPSVVRTIATEVRLFAHNMREHNDLMERVIIAGARGALRRRSCQQWLSSFAQAFWCL